MPRIAPAPPRPDLHVARRRLPARCLIGMLAGWFGVAAAADLASEAAIKAAFVYNFAKFVEWQSEPAGSTGEVRVCVAGVDSELSGTVAALEGRPVQSRSVSVKRDVKASDIDGCHILLVGANAKPVADAARGRPGILSISDVRGFAASGGVIELFNDEGKIRFEINPRAAQKAGLKVSSQILKLARITPDQ